MLSAITAIIAGCGRAKRPADRTDAAAVDKDNSMSTKDSARVKPLANDRTDEPTHTSIGLWTNDIGDDSEGELAATYAPDGGAMDGQIIYARPRDHVGLEANR